MGDGGSVSIEVGIAMGERAEHPGEQILIDLEGRKEKTLQVSCKRIRTFDTN